MLHFGTGTATLLEVMREAGGHVIGVDWRTPLDDARRRLGDGVAVQGNLDPLALQAPREFLTRRVEEVLARAGTARATSSTWATGSCPRLHPIK